MIAVGGHAGRLPIPGAELGLTYEDIRELTALPVSVVVIGGADTGCQLASILVDFGSKVTVLEFAPRIKPRADARRLGRRSTDAFEANGIRSSPARRANDSNALAAGVTRSRTDVGDGADGASTRTRCSSPSAGRATPTRWTPPPSAWTSSAAT